MSARIPSNRFGSWTEAETPDGSIVLVHEKGQSVPLADVGDSAGLLAAIVIVTEQPWATAADVGNFILMVRELIGLESIIGEEARAIVSRMNQAALQNARDAGN